MSETADSPWIAAPGEDLCLDFANSRYWRGALRPTEELGSFADLLAWCRRKAGLPAGEEAALAGWAAAEGPGATELFAEALVLRETIYRLFHGAGAASPGDLARLNRALALTTPRLIIEPVGAGFGWRVEAGAPSTARLLTPVLWSAADLLTGGRLARVRHCANPECQWLFLDDSKSGNRRWCAMSACGNRAKAHRHYARKKGAASD